MYFVREYLSACPSWIIEANRTQPEREEDRFVGRGEEDVFFVGSRQTRDFRLPFFFPLQTLRQTHHHHPHKP